MSEQQEKISSLVKRIEKHQKELKLNDSQFVARYQRYIGTSKTWRERLCTRNWKEFGTRLDKWEKKLTAFVLEIDGGSDLETYYTDLPIAKYTQAAYHILQGTDTDRRCVWIIGTTGTGKTWALRKIAQDNRTDAAYLSANETWKDSRMQIARGFALALGCAEGLSAAGTFRNVLEHLKGHPITLCVDEMHEGGVLLMKLVKSIINETRAKLMLGIYPTAWSRLLNGSTDATAEAQQLLGRSLKPIATQWVRGLTLKDVEKYLDCAAGLNGDCRVLAERILPEIRRGGNLRFLADSVELARMNADETGEDLDGELIEAAVRELLPAQERK